MATMSQREARLILNLTDESNSKAIRQAHIKLMLLNHPDSGNLISKLIILNTIKIFLLKLE